MLINQKWLVAEKAVSFAMGFTIVLAIELAGVLGMIANGGWHWGDIVIRALIVLPFYIGFAVFFNNVVRWIAKSIAKCLLFTARC